MSASVDEISNVVNGIDCDDHDDDDDDDEEEEAAIGNKLQSRRRRGLGKAKEVAMLQFKRAKKQLRRIRSRRLLLRSSLSSSSTTGNASNRGSSGKVIVKGTENGSGRTGCKFCFSRPMVLESADGSPNSDPNDPNFTHSMLRALIETNDFYSKECNPHLD